MKLYAKLSNEKGKIEGLGANEYLDIDINVGYQQIASFTLRRCSTMVEDGMIDIDRGEVSGWVLYDNNDAPLYWIEDKGKKQKGEMKIGPHGGVIDLETGFLKPYEDEHDE